MVQIFKRNIFFNSLLLLPYAVLLRLHAMLYPMPSGSTHNAIQAWVYTIAGGALGSEILATFLVFIQAVYINRIVITNRLSNEITLLPGMVYILLCSILLTMLPFSATLVASTFVLVAVSRALSTYRKPTAAGSIFDIAFYISIASILYAPAIILVVMGYLSQVILRSVKWRDSVQFLAGMMLPYFLWWTCVMYAGDTTDFTAYISRLFSMGLFDITSTYTLLTISVAVGLAIIPVLTYTMFTSKRSIQVQKKVDIFYWLLLCSGLSVGHVGITAQHLYILAIPLCFFISQYILRFKNMLTAEIIHLLVVCIILLSHYGILDSLLAR